MFGGFLYLLVAGHFIKPVGSSHRSRESSTAASLVVSGLTLFGSVRQDEFAHRSKGPVTDRNLLDPIDGPPLLLCARLGSRE